MTIGPVRHLCFSLSCRRASALLVAFTLWVAACSSQSGSTPTPTTESSDASTVEVDFDTEEKVDVNAKAFTPTQGRQVMRRVAGSETGFVAVGYEYEIRGDRGPEPIAARSWFSGDGINWERTDLDDKAEIRDVTAFGAGFVAVGSTDDEETGSDGAIWTSTDGREWERLAEVDGKPIGETFGISLYGVTRVGDDLYATGSDIWPPTSNPGSFVTAWKSQDGQAWTRARSRPLRRRVPVRAGPLGRQHRGRRRCGR